MKKPIGKKLTLSKTTVANLSKTDLDEVKGGYATATCVTGPICTFHCTSLPTDPDYCE